MKLFNFEKKQIIKAKKIISDEIEWRKLLNSSSYHVLKEKRTVQQPFTGRYNGNKKDGIYKCAACGNDVFHSDFKFDSGTGWPSFCECLNDLNISLQEDNSHFMKRIEVLCSRCESHLGHVFDDGPLPSGKRYCINSVSLKFY